MSTIIDQNSTNIQNGILALTVYDNRIGAAAGFKGNGAKISAVHIPNDPYLDESFYVEIYASSGTFGDDATPTGSPLAVSDNAQSNLSPEGWLVFPFTGNNQLQTVAGTNYFVCLITKNHDVLPTEGLGFSGNDVSQNGGNTLYYVYSYDSWVAANGNLAFKVYGVSSAYAVVYDGSGSTGGSVPSDGNSYSQGASVTVKANTGNLVKSGYNFIGWATISGASTSTFAVTGSNVNPSNFNMPASHVTLYAVWQIITATVVYDGNGQTIGSAPSDSNSPYNSGSSVTVLGNSGNLVKTNYTFLGWSTNSSASSAQYTQGQTFTITQNTTLYAVWQSTGGSGFDGGVINNPLEIKCKFLSLPKVWSDVSNWMSGSAANPSDYSAFLRFTNVNLPLNLSTDIYGVTLRDTNNNPFAAIGINDSLLVRKNFFAQFGSIGELSVPSGLKVDSIENFANNKDLTITANVGKKVKLDGDVHITGNLTGGGGAGGSFDGGQVNDPISIKDDFIHLYYDESKMPNPPGRLDWSVKNWIYSYDNYVPRGLPPGAKRSDNIGLRFVDKNYPGGWYTNVYGAVLRDPLGGLEYSSPAFCVSDHLFVRRDFYIRGKMTSLEGAIVLHGNGPNAQPQQPLNPAPNEPVTPPSDRWHIGWGPRVGTPFILLAQGGDDKYGIGGNPDAETLLIVTNNDPDNPPPEGNILGSNIGKDLHRYKWGHLECGNIAIHGTNNIIQAGQSRTNYQNPGTPNVVATKTVMFKRAFKHRPSVIITPNNQNNQDKKIYFEVTEVTLNSFTVKSYEIDHIHRSGSITGELGVPNPSQLQMRAVGMNDVNGDNHTLGSVLITHWSNNTAKELFTGAVKQFMPITAYFFWQAVAQTQYTVDANPPGDIEVEVIP